MLVGTGAGLDVDDTGRGHDLRDAPLDRVGGDVRLFEAGRAGDANGNVDKITLAGAADAHAFDLEHAFGFLHGGGDLLAEAPWRNVEQGVCRAAAELPANPVNHAGNAQGSDGVQLAEPRDSEFQSKPCTPNAED